MNILLFICLIFIIFMLFKYKNHLPYTYIFSFFWFINLGVSELFFADYLFSTGLYVLIISSIIFCFIGEIIGFKKNRRKLKKVNFNNTRFKFIFWIFFILAMGFPIVYLVNNGISLLRLLAFQSLLEVNNEVAIARYTDETEKSLVSQFCLIFVYALPIYTALLFRFYQKKKYFLFSLLPALVVLLTQNTKLVLMSTVLSLLTGGIVQSIIFDNRLPKVKVKSMFFSLLGFIMFYSLMLFSFIARIGRFDETTISIANSKIASYVAHIPALDYWLRETDFDNMLHTYGVKTFFGIANTFGIAERKSGVFKDFLVFEDSGQSFQTNIYTVYRFLIEDFGFIGTLCFFLFIAFIFSTIRGINNVSLKLSVISMLVFFIFNSYVASVWAYFSYIVAYIVLYFAIKFVLDFKIKKL